MGVFINYRRTDSAQAAGRVYDRLVDAFGKERVFMDIDSIPVGSRFADHIEKSLKDCSVVVAMIGRDWLSANPVGSRRIDEIDDYVRSEIRYAIQRGIPIVPLLLDGAAMPSVSQSAA